MPNEKGWYTKEEVLESGLPYYIPRSEKWTSEPYQFAVLLSKSRCKKLGMPTLRSGNEKPSAFKYAANAGAGTGDITHRYVPLYDRTDVFEAGELSLSILFKGEMMGTPSAEENGMKIEITVWSDGEELSADISGFYGSFGAMNGVGIAQLIGSQSPYLDHVIKQIKHEPYAVWTVMAEVKYVEPEIQYGTGEGDIFKIPGYYMVGNVLSIEKHPQDAIESTEFA